MVEKEEYSKRRKHRVVRSTVEWLNVQLVGQKIKVLFITVLNILNGLSYIANAILTKELLDGALKKNGTHFFYSTMGLATVLILQLIIRYAQKYFDERVKSEIENTLKMHAYQKVMYADFSEVSKHHTGDYLNRMTSDTVVVAEGITSVFPTLIGMLTKLFFASIVLAKMEPKFAFVFLVGGGVVILLSYAFRRKLKQLHRKVQETDGDVRAFLQETLQNLVVLRAFSVQKKAEGIADGKMQTHKKARMKRIFFSNVCNLGFGGAMNGGYLFGLIWCGYGIMQGRITYGTLAAVLKLIDEILHPVSQVTGYLPKFYGMFASAERLMEMDEMEKETGVNERTSTEKEEIYQKLKNIVVSNVSFSYPGKKQLVLNGAELSIKKGEQVAITGRSGIGKSTMFKLLLAIYSNYTGKIEFQCEKETYKVDASMRGMFTYVPQGNLLMSGTILDAIDLFHVEGVPYTDKERQEIQDACKIACADDFIEKLPQKYESFLGEKGAGLSEGQIQRLAIARAIYSKAPIILLDEATSALDLETEIKVLDNIKRLTDKTVIIVTHRKAALSMCNKIVEMRDERFYVVKE